MSKSTDAMIDRMNTETTLSQILVECGAAEFVVETEVSVKCMNCGANLFAHPSIEEVSNFADAHSQVCTEENC